MERTDNHIMAVSALDIAGVFLEMSKEVGLTNLKLNKLIYLAHGYYWGNYEAPLITNGELPEAWKHGPVYRSVYNTFRSSKSDVIPLTYAARPTNLSSNEEMSDFLNQFWEIFKDAPPWHLVEMLHEKDSPWYIIWHHQGGKFSTGSHIPDYLTKAYYIAKVKELNGST